MIAIADRWDVICARIVAVWQKPLPESTKAAWKAALEPYDGADVEQAVIKLSSESKYQPTLAEIIAATRRLHWLEEEQAEAERREHVAERLTPPAPLVETMRASSEFGALLHELVALWRAGKVPQSDYLRMTNATVPGRFMHNGQATETWKQELRAYIQYARSVATSKRDVVGASENVNEPVFGGLNPQTTQGFDTA